MIDHILVTTVTKCKEYEICFTGKTTLFRRYFQFFKARAARADFSSNAHQFCTSKCSFFMRETDFVFLGILDVVCGL